MLYPGSELELFKDAKNWKKYFASYIIPYIKGEVLEVGAGIGSTTEVLFNGNCQSWICLEPDPNLSAVIQEKVNLNQLPSKCIIQTGTIETLEKGKFFDTVLYIDVMEHIENDTAEIQKAFDKLKPGGCLIVLVPAYQYLYSPFDKAIGHYRRYNQRSLKKILPKQLNLKKIFYLDSMGVLLSFINKTLLKQSSPTIKQITFWNRYIIPMSYLSDKLSFHKIGRSLIMIGSKY